MGPTAMEELSDLVCGASRCAVPESMGQYPISPWARSAWCLGMAMDGSTWEPAWTGLAHTAGNISTQTSTGRKRWSHARPVKSHPYAFIVVWQLADTDWCFGISTPLVWLVGLCAAGNGQVHWGFLHSPCTTVRLVSAHASRCWPTDTLVTWALGWTTHTASCCVWRYNQLSAEQGQQAKPPKHAMARGLMCEV